MALFNHEITYNRCNEHGASGVRVHIDYDNAFGKRQSLVLGLPAEVDHVKVGGMATTSPLIYTGIVVGFNESKSMADVKDHCGNIYNCVFASDENFDINDVVIIAEHLSHIDGKLNKFDWLATTHYTNFQLNSIRVIAKDVQGIDICHVNIDPYIGVINFDEVIK